MKLSLTSLHRGRYDEVISNWYFDACDISTNCNFCKRFNTQPINHILNDKTNSMWPIATCNLDILN